jgi:5-methylcytosine-specific restriction endonuclease McrA
MQKSGTGGDDHFHDGMSTTVTSGDECDRVMLWHTAPVTIGGCNRPQSHTRSDRSDWSMARAARRRGKFSESVRAQAFVRDRALCCYSGKNLWIADADAWGSHCDHFVPASQGGSDNLENAVTCVWGLNVQRGNRTAPPRLFEAGEITKKGLMYYGGAMPDAIARHLDRMSTLRESDFRLAAAFNEFHCGVQWLGRCDRDAYDRDAVYYAGTMLNALRRWRTGAEEDGDSLPEQRGLAPAGDDEVTGIRWAARCCMTLEQIVDLMNAATASLKESEEPEEAPLSVETLQSLFRGVARATGRDHNESLAMLFQQYATELDAIAAMIPCPLTEEESVSINVPEVLSGADLVRVLRTYVRALGNERSRAERIVKAINARYPALFDAIAASLST